MHIEFTSVIAILRLIPLLYKIISERSMFLNRPKTLLYLQNGKAQISISSVSQTKELITDTGNRDQVFLATPLGLFSNLPGPLPITSCVKQVWLLLLADIFRRQNVEVQCSRGSFAFAWQKIEETPRPSAYNFDIQKVSRKTNSNSVYDRVKAPLRSSDYYHNHPLNSVGGTIVLFTQYQLIAKIFELMISI